MVANKSKLDKNIDDRFHVDFSKISYNFDITSNSSSDESSKDKSESNSNPDHSLDTLDSSAKDESGDEPKNLNSTYLCRKFDTVGDCSGDAKLKELQDGINLDDTKKLGQQSKIGKCRNLFSLSNNFDTLQWYSEVCSFKTENSASEDSRLADENTDDSVVAKLRNYLAEYQESRGIPREPYTFSTLIRVMGQAIGRCLLALFYVIVNIAPVLEIFHHILRFITDKIIDIKNTSNVQQIITKTTIFFVQLVAIYICLIFMFGFIVFPVIRMAFGILTKFMLYD